MPTRVDVEGRTPFVQSGWLSGWVNAAEAVKRDEAPARECRRCSGNGRPSYLATKRLSSKKEAVVMITGRCECAKVRYQVDGELKDFCHCHCSICRRIHGAAFATWGGVARDEFRFLSGEDSLRTYSFSENADSLFCENCSSTILVDFKPEADMLYITVGTVDGDIDCPNGCHQFVGSKAPWYEICDDMPQHDEWPEDST